MLKPGWQTSEFWVAGATQFIALLMIVGVISPADKATMEGAVTATILGVFTLMTNVVVIVHYVAGRLSLKKADMALTMGSEIEFEDHEPPDHDDGEPQVIGKIGGVKRAVFPAILAIAGLLLFSAPASAQMLPWRDQVNRRIDAQQQQINILLQQRQSPAPAPIVVPAPAPSAPQIIVLGGPYQQLPIGGPPLQQLPIGGPPLQKLPIEGPPQQVLPLPGPPQQQLPLPGQPQQQLPIAGPVPQPLPVPKLPEQGPAPQLLPTGQPNGFQRYSTKAIWR